MRSPNEMIPWSRLQRASLLLVEEKGVEAAEEDYEQLGKELEKASPLETMDKALEKFGTDIAIGFSGAEDVGLIEYAKLTGREEKGTMACRALCSMVPGLPGNGKFLS